MPFPSISPLPATLVQSPVNTKPCCPWLCLERPATRSSCRSPRSGSQLPYDVSQPSGFSVQFQGIQHTYTHTNAQTHKIRKSFFKKKPFTDADAREQSSFVEASAALPLLCRCSSSPSQLCLQHLLRPWVSNHPLARELD